VCAQWDTFEAFAADMGEPPTSQHTIERRDNDKGYHPSNCYWGTRTEQARNIPSHVKMDVGKAAQVRMLYSTRKFRQKDLAEQFNVSISTINHIICNRKWL
jgi:hypothetical protein